MRQHGRVSSGVGAAMGKHVLADTALKVVDLSACAGIRIEGKAGAQSIELSLPREGFAEAAKAFVPFVVAEILRADVEKTDVNGLLWSFDGGVLEHASPAHEREGMHDAGHSDHSPISSPRQRLR
jgi:hypothetical protein